MTKNAFAAVVVDELMDTMTASRSTTAVLSLDNQVDDDQPSCAAARCGCVRTETLVSDASEPSDSVDNDKDDCEQQTAAATTEKEPATTPSKSVSLVGRIVREISWKREASQRVIQRQQQRRDVEQLFMKYKSELKDTLEALEAARVATCDARQAVLAQMKTQITLLLLEGHARAQVELFRCVQLLDLRRCDAELAIIALKQDVARTRYEECDWMLKSCEVQDAASPVKAVDDSDQQEHAIWAMNATDPFFAPAEQLFQVHAPVLDAQTQLVHVTTLLTTMQRKYEEQTAVAAPASSAPQPGPGPPLKKRTSSFRERSSSCNRFTPSTERKQELEAILCRVATMQAREKYYEDARQRLEVSDQLNLFTQLVGDHRTRVGGLLRAFVAKIKEEMVLRLTLTAQDTATKSATTATDPQEDEPLFSLSIVRFLQIADQLNEQRHTSCEDDSDAMAVQAIDCRGLPRPASVGAFARFLRKTLVQEYALDQGVSKHVLEACSDSLDECVHHLVFSAVSRFYSDGMEPLCCQPHLESGADAHVLAGHWHWKHTKRRIQGCSIDGLAFPAKAADEVMAQLQSRATRAFLPKSLRSFRAVEVEVTPKGVVRAIMRAFGVFYAEVMEVFAPDGGFMNADLLIPSLVLMMTRLESDQDLDWLWRRVQLVKTFQPMFLPQTCEDAYYVTCLDAAMEFVMMFARELDGEDLENPCGGCSALLAKMKAEIIRENNVEDAQRSFRRSSSSSGSYSSHPKWDRADEMAVDDLSMWLSSQTSPQQPDAASGASVEEHELWINASAV